jgi:hypothetical protein
MSSLFSMHVVEPRYGDARDAGEQAPRHRVVDAAPRQELLPLRPSYSAANE